MGDDAEFHKAALKLSKRGTAIAVWSLVVAVLGLGYTVFADLGGIEWAKGAVSGWVEESSEGPASEPTSDEATSDDAVEDDPDSPAAEKEASEGALTGFAAFWSGWLVKPGLSVWTGAWHLGLIGLGLTVIYAGINLFVSKVLRLGDWLFYLWLLETLALLVMLIVFAAIMAEGYLTDFLLFLIALIVHWPLWGLIGLWLSTLADPYAEDNPVGLPTEDGLRWFLRL